MAPITPAGNSENRSARKNYERLDRLLDMALDLTFPGSDPVAITVSTNEPSEVAGLRADGGRSAALPNGCEAYRRTPVFTQHTVPAEFLKRHRAESDVWALIHVIDGRLLYRIIEPAASETVVEPTHPAVIEPTVLYEVAPLGATRFYIEFHRPSHQR